MTIVEELRKWAHNRKVRNLDAAVLERAAAMIVTQDERIRDLESQLRGVNGMLRQCRDEVYSMQQGRMK